MSALARWSLALLLPSVAVLGWGLEAAAPEIAPSSDSAREASRPPLAFAQYAVNLGQAPPQPTVGARYRFTNTSDEPVHVLELKPDCQCLRPTLSGAALDETDAGTIVPPGQSADVAVHIVTANEQPGPLSEGLDVRTRDAAGREYTQRLTFRVDLPEQKLTLQPSELFFYQLRGQAGSQVVKLVDEREQPARVTGVGIADVKGTTTPISEFVDVRVIEDEPGRTVAEVRVREGLPEGQRIGHVVFRVDDPRQDRVLMPIMLYGQMPRPTGVAAAP